jgi:hypothetical protein
MLNRMTVLERVVAWARQHGFDLQVEAITQCDADSKRALVDAQELYASAEARASAVIKQEEDLTVCHTPIRDSLIEASIRVLRMFNSHVQ